MRETRGQLAAPKAMVPHRTSADGIPVLADAMRDAGRRRPASEQSGHYRLCCWEAEKAEAND